MSWAQDHHGIFHAVQRIFISHCSEVCHREITSLPEVWSVASGQSTAINQGQWSFGLLEKESSAYKHAGLLTLVSEGSKSMKELKIAWLKRKVKILWPVRFIVIRSKVGCTRFLYEL
jgi:hypothetical protein